MYWEAAILLILCALGGLQVILARAQARLTREAAEFLSSELAQVISKTLEDLPGAVIENFEAPEPMNPIQMMLAQLLQEKLQGNTVTAQVIQQGDDGKFKKLDDF
jgi:hypothetical protein